MTLRDLLTTMRDTQIDLGQVPGTLPNTMSISRTTLTIASGDDQFDDDPLSKFLSDYPAAIPYFFEGLDAAMAQATIVIDGQTPDVQGDSSARPTSREPSR